jgi:hypothetical protein
MPRLSRLGPLKWLALLDLGRVAVDHFSEHLTSADRRRVATIAKKSKGDPRKLTAKERADLKAIAGRLELLELGRNVVPALVRGRAKRKR